MVRFEKAFELRTQSVELVGAYFLLPAEALAATVDSGERELPLWKILKNPSH